MDASAPPIRSRTAPEPARRDTFAPLPRRAAAEFLGTAFLLAGIVGSGVAGERLAGGNVAIALLASSIATGGILVAAILAAAPISGAHFNPLVTIAAAARGEIGWGRVPGYVVAQFAGAVIGTVCANVMFDRPAIEFSRHVRGGEGQWLAEAIATVGLLLVIAGCKGRGATVTALAVAAYIVAAYWFTSSTSFANPAVTFARCLTDTFAGIRPVDVPGFVIAQSLGLLAVLVLTALPRAPAGRP